MKAKWIATLVNVCAILLIAASLFVLLTVVITPSGQVPQILGFSMFRVITGSMEPAIPEKTLLLVRRTDPQEISPGDVITFFSPDPELDGAPITHRVLEVQKQEAMVYFITKGDANLIADAYPVTGEYLIGKVVFASAALGTVISLLSNPLVFGLIIVVPMLVILLKNLIHSVRLAADLTRQEEEAAVRQALEAMQTKHDAQAEQHREE